jgi:hypothetical protein
LTCSGQVHQGCVDSIKRTVLEIQMSEERQRPEALHRILLRTKLALPSKAFPFASRR